MMDKAKIKVIKRGQNQAETKVEQNAPKSSKALAREMVSNVTNWVNDFQQKRREETTQALQMLINERPEPSGA
jgi:hypothetical protein